jgi:hypothetical protein
MPINCRIDCNIISELMAINPSIVTQDSVTQQLKFRHGALGKYISRLILEDIAKRKERKDDDLLARFMT